MVSTTSNKPAPIPKGKDWPALLAKDGDELEIHYRHTLEELGKRSGMLGVIFRKAQNKIQDPAKLRRLIVDLIDKEQWSSLSADVKGDAYEGLLQKNAEDVKGGAGQQLSRFSAGPASWLRFGGCASAPRSHAAPAHRRHRGRGRPAAGAGHL